MIIYLTGPLFSEADKTYLCMLSQKLQNEGYVVFWPGTIITGKDIVDFGTEAPAAIFNYCRDALERSNLVVALLDGAQVDDGTAWEIGYAYAKGIPVYGLRTDVRQAGETRHNQVNSMIQECLVALVGNTQELFKRVVEEQVNRNSADEAKKRG